MLPATLARPAARTHAPPAAPPAAPRILWLNPGESPEPRIGKPEQRHHHNILPYCLFKRGGYYPEVCIRSNTQDGWTTHPCPHPPRGYRSLRLALEQALTQGRAIAAGTPLPAPPCAPQTLADHPAPPLRNLIVRLLPHPRDTWGWAIDEAPADLQDTCPATVLATSPAPLPTRALALAEGEQALALVAAM